MLSSFVPALSKKSMRYCLYLISCAVLFFFSGCIKDGMPDGADLGPGDSLPRFSVTMNDGSVVSSGDLAGSVSAVVFFHTGCPDCRAVMPALSELYGRYSDEVRFLFISREEGAESVAAYWAENGYSMPYCAREDREIYSLFARTGVPRIYVSDEDMVIRHVFTDSPVPGLEDIEDAILSLK